jgi:hypothetical protein
LTAQEIVFFPYQAGSKPSLPESTGAMIGAVDILYIGLAKVFLTKEGPSTVCGIIRKYTWLIINS